MTTDSQYLEVGEPTAYCRGSLITEFVLADAELNEQWEMVCDLFCTLPPNSTFVSIFFMGTDRQSLQSAEFPRDKADALEPY